MSSLKKLLMILLMNLYSKTMRRFFLLTKIIFLASCASIDEQFLIQSDIEKNGNAQEILDQLNDPELRKGKVFVFSNIQDDLWRYVRVNGDELFMRDQEVQIFDLVGGENDIYTFGKIFGDEVGNCSKEPYSFNTEDFRGLDTHYFMILKPAALEFIGRMVSCYKEVHLKEEAFFYYLENPRSRWNWDWVLNKRAWSPPPEKGELELD